MKGGRAPEVLKYENYLVTSTCPVDIGFRGNELNLQDGSIERSDQNEERKGATPGGTPGMAINYGNDPTISYFIFEHKGGTPLKVTDIGIVMSQACDPFTGIFARMAWDDEDNFLADVKDAEDLIRPVTEQINPNRRKEEQIIYDEDSTECQFLDVVVEGTVNREDDRIKALICSNEGEPITVKIKFYVPTPILNLRAKS